MSHIESAGEQKKATTNVTADETLLESSSVSLLGSWLLQARRDGSMGEAACVAVAQE